ncbi:acyltransferase domain-containing protein [Amycolatopsis panacis]|uniref:[acyl-carrier-protein] S-malonyltransferase n=2 Tax=Amycolatopsis panacis TaxID=2340917 RepID=A0A419I1K8_9PSEU|nr:acyltransferase domain-containing protein [Amycolatopsis panacis]
MGPARAGELGRFLVIDPLARRRVAVADEALGYRLVDRLREAGDEYTEYLQIAFVLASLALAERAEAEHGLTPVVCGGSSFGERAAVVRSGALPLAELVRLVAGIARCEQEYFTTRHQDLVSQFVVRLPEECLPELLDGMVHDVSGRFDPDVHLITLAEADLDEFIRRVRAAGGYALTTMRPAAHSPRLTGLRDRLADEVFGRYSFRDPELPVVSDQDGALLRTGEAVASLLLESTVTMVRLPELAARFARLGVRRTLVPGPDHLLHRLPGLAGQTELLRADVKEALKPRRPRRRATAVAA